MLSKRIVLLFLLVALAFVSIVGCGSSPVSALDDGSGSSDDSKNAREEAQLPFPPDKASDDVIGDIVSGN